MSDDYRKGNPRTMKDHQAWRLRDVQRRQASDRRDAVMQSGLQISMIVGVNRSGDVQLEDYTDELGNGQWFSCLNNIVPSFGQWALYGFIGDGPVVIGVLPNEYETWKAPNPRMWTEMEHFIDTLTDATGQIGRFNWRWSNTGGFSFQITTPNQYGLGWWRLHTNGSGTNSVIRSRYALFYANKIREIEFGFIHTYIASVGLYLGLSDDVSTYDNSIVAQYDTAAGHSSWNLHTEVGGVTGNTDTGVPAAANHYMIAKLRNIDDKTWELEVTDVDTGESASVSTTSIPSGGMYIVAGIYDRSTGIQRSLDLDYIRWTMYNIVQGPSDYWDE